MATMSPPTSSFHRNTGRYGPQLRRGVALLGRLVQGRYGVPVPESGRCLARRRASVKRGERPHKKTAITRTELQAMLATCDTGLEDLRDRTLLCFGFASGGRRRSEIAAADCADLLPLPEGGYVYWLEHSKTQQAGPSPTSTPDKPVLGQAAEALQAWLEAAQITEGPLFRRLWGPRVGPGLSAKSVASIVQRRSGH